MLITFTAGGHTVRIDPRRIACITNTAPQRGAVAAVIHLAGAAQPLALELPQDVFDRLCAEWAAACSSGAPCSPADLKDAIVREMVVAMKRLGAKGDLLGVACSYGETYTDGEVLAELREWNESGYLKAEPESEFGRTDDSAGCSPRGDGRMSRRSG